MTSRVLVTGATGYIGGRLVPELLAAGHAVRCLARSPAKLEGLAWGGDVEIVEGDASESGDLERAMEGIDAAYYLLHSMGNSGAGDFKSRDRAVAAGFRDAAAGAGVGQIIYLGGLGDDDDPDLSPHLRSRHEVGRLLAEGPVPVTELRAAIIIGSGSASFEMLRSLTEVLPVMVTPTWVSTRCQPVAIRDILYYLVGVLGRTEAEGRVLEVGGPDVMSYLEVMRAYAEIAGLRRRVVIKVPVLTPNLSSHWVGLVTPIPTGLAKPLIGSLLNEVVVRDPAIQSLLPRTTMPFRQAVELALQHSEDFDVATSWTSAELAGRSPAAPMPTDPDWAGGKILEDVKESHVAATPSAVYRTITSLGGKRGWYVAGLLWSIRGLIDQLVGGVGMRRGRRHPSDLRVGDPVDFWRVEALVADRLMRLRAEMRLPGQAWLDFTIEPEGDGSHLVQRARFYPRGLWGRAYWYALVPFHALIFGRLLARVAAAAEVRADRGDAAGDEALHGARPGGA